MKQKISLGMALAAAFAFASFAPMAFAQTGTSLPPSTGGEIGGGSASAGMPTGSVSGGTMGGASYGGSSGMPSSSDMAKYGQMMQQKYGSGQQDEYGSGGQSSTQSYKYNGGPMMNMGGGMMGGHSGNSGEIAQFKKALDTAQRKYPRSYEILQLMDQFIPDEDEEGMDSPPSDMTEMKNTMTDVIGQSKSLIETIRTERQALQNIPVKNRTKEQKDKIRLLTQEKAFLEGVVDNMDSGLGMVTQGEEMKAFMKDIRSKEQSLNLERTTKMKSDILNNFEQRTKAQQEGQDQGNNFSPYGQGDSNSRSFGGGQPGNSYYGNTRTGDQSSQGSSQFGQNQGNGRQPWNNFDSTTRAGGQQQGQTGSQNSGGYPTNSAYPVTGAYPSTSGSNVPYTSPSGSQNSGGYPTNSAYPVTGAYPSTSGSDISHTPPTGMNFVQTTPTAPTAPAAPMPSPTPTAPAPTPAPTAANALGLLGYLLQAFGFGRGY